MEQPVHHGTEVFKHIAFGFAVFDISLLSARNICTTLWYAMIAHHSVLFSVSVLVPLHVELMAAHRFGAPMPDMTLLCLVYRGQLSAFKVV